VHGFVALPAIAGVDKLLGRFFDVALRDFGLLQAALALGRLAVAFDHRRLHRSER
jgi:hypothetical protein